MLQTGIGLGTSCRVWDFLEYRSFGLGLRVGSSSVCMEFRLLAEELFGLSSLLFADFTALIRSFQSYPIRSNCS